MQPRQSGWRSPFLVGEWTVDPQGNRVSRGSEDRHLQPMIMALLCLLAQRAGQVVTKDQILDEVWEGRFVSESALTRAVAELRRLLDDRGRPPRYIETVPKRGYRLVAKVEGPRQLEPPRLAVLPFVNLGGDPSEEYFADGVSDAIITELGKMAALRVTSRQSTLQFKGSRLAPRAIARSLDVNAILEGSVQRNGTLVRLTAQLIEAEPERHLWAESYDSELTDVLSLQRQLARRVAGSVHAALGPAGEEVAQPPGRVLPDAHLAYLKGRYFLGSWTKDGVERGLAHLWQAVAIDPACAPAYEELALAMLTLAFFGHLPVPEAFPQARFAALKALELDESLSNARVVLGFVHWQQDWDLATCRREFERAIALNESNTFARMSRALFAITICHDKDLMASDIQSALAIDPLGLHSNFAAAWLWLFARDLDKAADQARRTLQLHPDARQAVFVLAFAELARGRALEAAALLETAVDAGGDLLLASLGHMYGRSGQADKARAIMARFRDQPGAAHQAIFTAQVAAGLGELDLAFDALERAWAERDSHLFGLPLIPTFDPLRADPRFDALLSRLAAPPSRPDS